MKEREGGWERERERENECVCGPGSKPVRTGFELVLAAAARVALASLTYVLASYVSHVFATVTVTVSVCVCVCVFG